jgi:hypothetical protein
MIDYRYDRKSNQSGSPVVMCIPIVNIVVLFVDVIFCLLYKHKYEKVVQPITTRHHIQPPACVTNNTTIDVKCAIYWVVEINFITFDLWVRFLLLIGFYF